jgi:DNA-binding MarR family transcriptional regulator
MTDAYEDEPVQTSERRKKPIAVWMGTAGFGDEMPPLAESIGFLVRIIQLQSFQLFYRRFDASGLSLGALTTLGAIHANPGIRHGVLADALMIKRPNFTKVITGLELDGLLTREAPRGDKRTTALFVTKKGVRKLETMRAAIIAYHEEMVACLSPAERNSLIDLLQRLSRHLQSLDQAPADD